MSKKHPIIAVTGSSGAGTSIAKSAFMYIFRKNGISPAIIDGDCFHRYNRNEMDNLSAEAEKNGKNLTHFGPEGNLFEELESVFNEYVCLIIDIISIKESSGDGPMIRYKIFANGKIHQVVPWKIQRIKKL